MATGSGPRPFTGYLFDRYLDRAEYLLAEADAQRQSLRRYRASVVWLTCVGAVAAVCLATVVPGTAARVVCLVVVVSATALAVISIRTALRPAAARAFLRDEDAMVEVVTVLRDTAVLLADKEHWDEERRRIARARLERFPVGRRAI